MKFLKKLIDMQSLGGFIKMLETNYDKTMLQQARDFFVENNQIHMANFLTEDSYLELKKNISQKSLKKDYKADEKSRNIGLIDSEAISLVLSSEDSMAFLILNSSSIITPFRIGLNDKSCTLPPYVPSTV